MNQSILVTRNSVKGNYLKNDFFDFKYKVGFLALHSYVNTNGKSSKNSLNRTLIPIEQKEKEIYDNGESSDPLLKNYQLERVRKFLSSHFQPSPPGAINLGYNSEYNVRSLKKRIAELFNADRDSSIIVYMGAADEEGNWAIGKENTYEKLSFAEVYDLWKARTSNQKLLLLILDHNYSGKWAKTLTSEIKDETVAIQAACREKERAHESELGGYLTHNLLKLFFRDQKNIYVIEKQTPVFAGDYLFVKKYTNLFINYKSWDDMMQMAKASYNIAVFENGDYYGYFKDGIRNFWGTMKWNSGPLKNAVYQGEFKNSKLEGKGMLTYADGKIHEGDFKNNVLNGSGIETFPNGDVYKGQFVKGIKSGTGTYNFAVGDTYSGGWVVDLPNGVGSLTTAKGNVYVGDFKNGLCSGKGKITYFNGDSYEGDWVDNEKHGEGIYTTKEGNVYKGTFVKGLRHGFGVMEYKNGEFYKGNWKDDVKSGEGVFWNRDGTQKQGEWKDDKVLTELHFFDKKGTNKIVFK